MPKEQAPLASSNVLMVISISCSVTLGIGQLVFQSLLQRHLSTVAPAAIVNRIISGGATELGSIVEETGIEALYGQYSKATTQVFVSQPCPVPELASTVMNNSTDATTSTSPLLPQRFLSFLSAAADGCQRSRKRSQLMWRKIPRTGREGRRADDCVGESSNRCGRRVLRTVCAVGSSVWACWCRVGAQSKGV